MKNIKNQSGFSLVELLVVVIIIAIIAAIAIPNLLASRRTANEAAAVSSMRTFHSANTTYLALQSPNSFAPTAVALSGGGLIDTAFSDAVDNATLKGGYNWVYTWASGTPLNYALTATSATGSGQRSYFINDTGAIRVAAPDGTAATVADPGL